MNLLKWLLKFGTYLLRTLAFGWLVGLIQLLKQLWEFLRSLCTIEKLPHPDKEGESCCITTTHPSVHRPDPCIYSQAFLMQQGLPVTWDNPDILIKRGGAIVAESELLPNTQYEIEATIWNNSYDGPAVGVQVDISFLSFGIGTASTHIGTAVVNVGVKGSAHHPGRVTVPWTTPATPGHYCIQVALSGVADDANPGNNMGQNNVDVAAAASPAQFKFPLRNPFDRPARFVLTVDSYRLPQPKQCVQTILRETRTERIRRINAEHRASGVTIPPGWDVAITPSEVPLDPDEEIAVDVTVTPPDSFIGSQTFNVNALAEGAVAGGVTLLVTKS